MANEDLFGISDEDKAAEKRRKNAAKMRAWRAQNPERSLVNERAYEARRRANPIKRAARLKQQAEQKREWRRQNGDLARLRNLESRRKHLEERRAADRRRRAENIEASREKDRQRFAGLTGDQLERRREGNRKRYADDPQIQRKSSRKWIAINRDKINAKNRQDRQNNIQIRIALNLRSRIVSAIRSGKKAGSAVRDLGCTIAEFKSYIEDKFVEGMSWNNWGNGDDKWNMDHIQPLASFDLTDPDQFIIAAHYTNYQPMWWRDNLRKGHKVLTAEVLNS